MAEQLPLALDLACRPAAEPPPGAVPAGPAALCYACGAFAVPFCFLVFDPLWCNDLFADRARCDPLCLDCTVARVKDLRSRGRHVPAFLGWTGGDHA